LLPFNLGQHCNLHRYKGGIAQGLGHLAVIGGCLSGECSNTIKGSHGFLEQETSPALLSHSQIGSRNGIDSDQHNWIQI